VEQGDTGPLHAAAICRDLRTMRVLITGCRGFLGSAIGQQAAQVGHDVMGVGRSSQAAPRWPGSYRQADVVDDDLSGLINEFRPDAIVHAAGAASVADSFVTPMATMRSSLMSWVNVLDAVRRTQVPARALLLSSAAVYGSPLRLPVSEGDALNPISPYGHTKVMSELAARSYVQSYQLDVVSCRLFSVLGSGQRRLLAWDIYRQVADTETMEVRLRGRGESSRDYLHVDDVAIAVLALSKAVDVPAAVNIASGEESSVDVVARAMIAMTGSSKPVRYLREPGQGDPDHWRADVTRLRGLLPTWTPRTLADALASCVDGWSAS
jgi:UDP-glucose 4-epimerase